MDKIDPRLIDAIMGDCGQPTAEGCIGVTCTPGCPCPEDCVPCEDCDCDLAEKQAENVGQSNATEASRLIYNALREAREREAAAAVDAVVDEMAEDLINRLEAFKGACDAIDAAAVDLKKQAYEAIFSDAPIPDEVDVHLEVLIPVNDADELPLTCRNLFIKTGPGTTLNFVGAVGDVDITAATGTVVSFEQDVVGDVTIVQGDGSDVNIERVDKSTDVEIEQGDGCHVTIEGTED